MGSAGDPTWTRQFDSLLENYQDTFHDLSGYRELQKKCPQEPGGRARLQPCRKGSVEKLALALVADSVRAMAKAICGGGLFRRAEAAALPPRSRTFLLQLPIKAGWFRSAFLYA